MLSDLLVLDLTTYLPGPFATQLLADFGARVVKVESPRGDPTRHLPPHDAEGVAASFKALNTSKESLALDLKTPAGRDLLLRLCERADVLTEGFRPGVMERLGVGPEPCLARNPRLIYARLTGYGQTGPYAEKAGHDLTYQAYAGALSLNTDREGFPSLPGVQSADLLGGLTLVVGVLTALRAAERDGRGRVVDASMLDALTAAQAIHTLNHRAGLAARARALPLNGGFPCYDLYATSCGGHVALAALEPKFWGAFCEVVERPDWLARAFDPSLRPELDALFAERSRDEWRVILENVECCFAPVLDTEELLSDDHHAARGSFGEQGVAPPLRFDPPARVPRRPAPRRPGEQSRALLSELLGLGEGELDGLEASGALGG